VTTLEEILRVTKSDQGVRSLIAHHVDPADTAVADTDL
jgi:hypothetical protein